MSNVEPTDSLEVVYYPSPVPLNWATFTLLALVFDRLHFPNVYLPAEGFNFDEARAEHDRICGLAGNDFDTAVLLQAMRFLPHVGQLKTFCSFTGDGQLFGATQDPRLPGIVDELEALLFGPRPAGNFPINSPCAHKGLPGGDQYFEYPTTYFYPATALVYANERGLPLVNDLPEFPVPSLGSAVSARDNAKILSTILAMECANFILPLVRPLHPLQIVEAREELQPHLRPFRLSLLTMAKELNAAIEQSTSDADIREHARFIVETTVTPQLEEVRAAIERPDKPWYETAFKYAKHAPSLAAGYSSIPLAVASGLAVLCDVLVDLANAQKRKQPARSGMYFLLKLREIAKPK